MGWTSPLLPGGISHHRTKTRGGRKYQTKRTWVLTATILAFRAERNAAWKPCSWLCWGLFPSRPCCIQGREGDQSKELDDHTNPHRGARLAALCLQPPFYIQWMFWIVRAQTLHTEAQIRQDCWGHKLSPRPVPTIPGDRTKVAPGQGICLPPSLWDCPRRWTDTGPLFLWSGPIPLWSAFRLRIVSLQNRCWGNAHQACHVVYLINFYELVLSARRPRHKGSTSTSWTLCVLLHTSCIKELRKVARKKAQDPSNTCLAELMYNPGTYPFYSVLILQNSTASQEKA